MTDIWTTPDFTTQTASVYKAAIDNTSAITKRIANSFNCHEQTTPDMTVRMEAGHLNINGVLTEVAAQDTGTITAPSTNPRIDRVVIDANDGTISVITGTEAASPSAPTITNGRLPVCQVLLATSTTSITNSLITDERTYNYLPAGTNVLIQSQTASSDSSIDFSLGLDGDFSKYYLRIRDLVPATDATSIYMRFSTDGGSTYLSTNSYKWALGSATSNAASYQFASSGSGSDDPQIQLTGSGAVGTGTGEFMNIDIILDDPSDTGKQTTVGFTVNGYSATPDSYRIDGVGSNNTGSAVDAIRILMSSGNIASGTFELYGVI